MAGKIEHAHQSVSAVAAREGDRLALARQEIDVAPDQRRVKTPKGKKPPIVLQQRSLVTSLHIDCLAQMLLRYRQPWAFLRETSISRSCRPDHRGAAAVTPLELRPEADAIWVSQILEGEIGFGQPQFLALIEADGTAQRHQQSGNDLEVGAGISLALGPARGMALHVMVGKSPARPAAPGHLSKLLQDVANLGGAEFLRGQEIECVAHLHALVVLRIASDNLK